MKFQKYTVLVTERGKPCLVRYISGRNRTKVLAMGTLPEILPAVRERWGQDGVSCVLDQAVDMQRPSSSD